MSCLVVPKNIVHVDAISCADLMGSGHNKGRRGPLGPHSFFIEFARGVGTTELPSKLFDL